MNVIDLRSDTVTLPTEEMRRAMAEAELGDDVMGEDPTVNRLEELAATKVGKEATLLTVSGTMSNLVGVLSHCQRGDEMIVGTEAHIFNYEVGGASALGGVHVCLVPNDKRGRLPLDALEAAIRPTGNVHFPRTGLICVENTHNRCGGAVLTPEDMAVTWELAQRYGIPVHLDGARIFNAAVYLGTDPRELTRYADSVNFCLSKGLAAPVGSLLCGSREFVARARKYRKMVGGGMRQAGVIAAAGIVALETMVDRLSEDHQTARQLAQGLAAVPGLEVNFEAVQTNIVALRVLATSGQELQRLFAAEGVKVSFMDRERLRLVTHYGITTADIDEALQRIRRVMERLNTNSR